MQKNMAATKPTTEAVKANAVCSVIDMFNVGDDRQATPAAEQQS